MPNHLHLLSGTSDRFGISDILRDFKKFTSKRIVAELERDCMESRRQWMLGRFRQTGDGDTKAKNCRFWQTGNHIEQVCTEAFFRQKLNYIHSNPVRAEFVSRPEDYLYSSAVDYAGGSGLIDVIVV